MKTNSENTHAGISGNTAEAFGRLYEQYLPGVFQYVTYRVADRDTAEDITSDIFNKALTKFGTYDPAKAAFSTWIFSIARNAIIDYFRHRGRMQKLQQATGPDIRSPSPSPEEQAARSDETRKLYNCLASLKPNEQELISLKFAGEMTNREIAKITGLSESNVGTILCRAVRKLRDEFAGWQE